MGCQNSKKSGNQENQQQREFPNKETRDQQQTQPSNSGDNDKKMMTRIVLIKEPSCENLKDKKVQSVPTAFGGESKLSSDYKCKSSMNAGQKKQVENYRLSREVCNKLKIPRSASRLHKSQKIKEYIDGIKQKVGSITTKSDLSMEIEENLKEPTEKRNDINISSLTYNNLDSYNNDCIFIPLQK